ncbi:MAG TPA: quinone-dependent dihydroorotate dehydrogenase [Puia sp.]|nr:quinone-dependent dihydroorotate dehydrogenase [Puia sp.]
MYRFLRTILFFFPAEGVHHFSMEALRLLCGWGPMRRLVAWACRPEEDNRGAGGLVAGPGAGAAPREFFGLRFRNPVGLGAGFDKNALYLRELDALGFGFVEIGTVTPRAQSGNDKPRLFRLPEDQALINRMGFNNDGVGRIADRVRVWRSRTGRDSSLIIGGNIGKNKLTANEDAWKDYEVCFRALYEVVDYFVVNVSSPNTPGLRELQDKEALRRILTNLQRVNRELSGSLRMRPRPLLLKIAPDLSHDQLNDVVDLAMEIGLDGLVAANTTTRRDGLLTTAERVAEIGAGGLSGAPLRELSTEVVRYCCARLSGRIPVIASGGIFTAADVREKQGVGAALVQVWTGFIYEGPFIVRRVCR